MASVEIKGLNDLKRRVDELEDSIVTVAVNKTSADVLLAAADRAVPVRTGDLRASGRTTSSTAAGVVQYDADHAGPVHHGSLNRPQGGFVLPNPWVYDASDSRREEIYDVYQDRVDELASKF